MVSATWLMRRALAVPLHLGLVALLAIASIFYARKVEQDDDVLAFLPQGSADVRIFTETMEF